MSAKPFDPSRISPFCCDLHSKKAVFLARPPRDEGELLDASRHCWCGETMQALGPDGDVVDPEDCRAGRACFKPYGGPDPRRSVQRGPNARNPREGLGPR